MLIHVCLCACTRNRLALVYARLFMVNADINDQYYDAEFRME